MDTKKINKKRAKRVVISGYFGFNNAGDELILNHVITDLQQHDEHLNITVLSANPSQTMTFFRVNSVDRWNPFSVLRVISRCDLLIFSGGLYQDTTSSWSLYYYLSLICLAKLLRRKILLYGVEIGPIVHKYNLWLLKQTIRLADKITVRTYGSYKFLASLEVPSLLFPQKVKVTADPVLSCSRKFDLSTKERKLNKIGLILHCPGKKQETKGIIQFCESLIRRLKVKLVFVPFHQQRDLKCILDISKNLSSPTTIVHWNKSDDLYDILSDVDFIISQRLHGLILGAVLGVPILGISVDPKINFFLKELGQKCFSLTEMNIGTLFGVLKDSWRWREEFKKNRDEKLPQLQYRSHLNLKTAIELLE